jgi:hypothetical protein
MANAQPSKGNSPNSAGLRKVLERGVIQSTFDLNHSVPLDLFFFIFMSTLRKNSDSYFSIAYSALAAMKMGMPGSASFLRARKSFKCAGERTGYP